MHSIEGEGCITVEILFNLPKGRISCWPRSGKFVLRTRMNLADDKSERKGEDWQFLWSQKIHGKRWCIDRRYSNNCSITRGINWSRWLGKRISGFHFHSLRHLRRKDVRVWSRKCDSVGHLSSVLSSRLILFSLFFSSFFFFKLKSLQRC